MRNSVVPDRVDQWRRENPAKAAMPTVRFYRRADGRQAIWVAHRDVVTLYTTCQRCGVDTTEVHKQSPNRRRRGLPDTQRWADICGRCRKGEDHFKKMSQQRARREKAKALRKGIAPDCDCSERPYGGCVHTRMAAGRNISDYRIKNYAASEKEIDRSLDQGF